eukprot:PLAT5384.2.p2 GENE.PLAT5384.2~~PLAT5384.2.p2  ORF type:complete len:106 (+),score=22.91 PLAT5384.2:32-349(+)
MDIPKPKEKTLPDGTVLSSSVGGTCYGCTPGGTRFVYDRSAMLALRESPLVRDGPDDLLDIAALSAMAARVDAEDGSAAKPPTPPESPPPAGDVDDGMIAGDLEL